jgi:hypothetical protein
MSKKQILNYKFFPANAAPASAIYTQTAALIEENKKFILEETLAYINYCVTNNISPFAYYSYDISKCRRDLSYVLEGYISDIKTRENRQTVFNALQYNQYGIPQITGNRLPEVVAHTFIQNLIDDYILQNIHWANRQSIVTQVIDQSLTPETGGRTLASSLSTIIINAIQVGASTIPAISSTRGYVKLPGFFKSKNILLIVNASRNEIIYNFADETYPIEVTYSELTDVDFPGAMYAYDKTTTITFSYNTSSMMTTDNLQIFVEGAEQTVRLNPIATDAMERMKVGIPQSMLDADFEYGLQPTKWQTVSTMRNYPSVYEVPGSDQAVVSVVSDASAGTSNVGASLITVTTVASHGYSVGTVFTIKALASSVQGFSRAEGTYQVFSVPTNSTFTYYAKSKVGTVNPTTLSTTYTQLRQAGYYTGASVGTPSFNVFSNGTSGTFTTNLASLSGSTFLGFSGTAPAVDSPLTASGIDTGTQVTSVTGTGGTVVAVQLLTTGAIGATNIDVTNTSGIVRGLIINRGDGKAVQVTNIVANTISLSGPLTSKIIGATGTYTNLTPNAQTGTGSGATFTVTRTLSSYSVAPGNSTGNGYVAGNTFTINGVQLDGYTPVNNATITVTSASPINAVDTFDITTLVAGSGYDAGNTTGLATTVNTGSGSGLTVNISVDDMGGVVDVSINDAGSGYSVGNVITVVGGSIPCTITVLTIQAGGAFISGTITGTVTGVASVNFISALTLSQPTSADIATSTSISYTGISVIEVTFQTPHGFLPGNSITAVINSTGSNAQYAAGSYYVEAVPTLNTIRYTARAPGTISNTLTGIIYSRPDSFYVHRPLDGGVQLGTGGPAHGAQAIRMSKKYIRYQSGKGIMYNTGALFAPSYNILSINAAGTTVGSVITLTTDDTDHGCQVGCQIQIGGVTTSGYNGIYTVTSIVNERTLTIAASSVLGSTTGVLGTPCVMSVRGWHGSTVRSGTFDDQNGMFWQYDGITMALVKRSSTFILSGTVNANPDSNSLTGTNTRFTQQLAAGDRIVLRGMSHVVSSIASDTQLYFTPDYRGTIPVVSGKACKTIDLIVPQQYWNLDTLDGNGNSGYILDVTKMQMIGMQWTWYGAGFIDFMLRGPEGNYVFAHRFRNSNVNYEAYMRTGNQPVRYEVVNEGAKDKLASACLSTDTTLTLTNSYYFPQNGTVYLDGELISFTNNQNNQLLNCTRGASSTQFVAGSTRNFTAGVAAPHPANTGVVLVSNTITPIISHWGSAFMVDGQFDNDRGYIFNYSATNVQASLSNNTAFLMRLAPSVSNAQVGDLGERELLNRAQLLLSSISVTSDAVSGGGALIIQGILNPQNYPTNPTNITWTGISSSAAGGQPSFVQIASGGSVTWSGNFSTVTATVYGAFTTTLTANSFAPITNTLTAISFNAVTNTTSAISFAVATSPTYNTALNTGRNDFLITTSAYNTIIATTPIIAGDGISATTYITGGQTVVSVTPNYVTLSGVSYTRIIMSAVANASSPAAASNNANNITITFTSSVAANYNSAMSTARTDFLITQTQYASSTIAVTDVLSVATYVTSGQTISSITPNYAFVGGINYARIVMSGAANATSTAGISNNVSITSTSAATATYASALSTSRTDFLVTNTAWANSGIAIGDTLSIATYLTGGQTIQTVTTSYVTIASVAYTRIVMSAAANATSASGGGNNLSLTVTAVGSKASYVNTNYLFFDSTTFYASNATVGTFIATTYTQFPAGTAINAISTRTFGATTVYRVSFTQTANTTIAAGATPTFQFGAAYALPGEQVFSFVSNPGSTDTLDLSSLKELTNTSIGGRGTFPNGPDVLAINVYKVAGSNTNANVIIRWGEAQA